MPAGSNGPSKHDPWHSYGSSRGDSERSRSEKGDKKQSRRRRRSVSSDSESLGGRSSPPSSRELLAAIQGLGLQLGSRMEQMEAVQGDQYAQLADHEARLVDLCSRLHQIEGDSASWKQQFQEWKENHSVSAISLGSEHLRVDSNFGRPADPCKLSVSAGGRDTMFSREALTPIVEQFCERANTKPEDVTILGKGVRRRFVLQFKSPSEASQLLGSLQKEDGSWESLHVLSPTQSQVRLFFASDKSAKQEKLEILTGAMARVFRTALELAPDSDRVFARKQQGLVNVDWTPVCSLELPSENDIVFLWNAPEVERLKLDKNELVRLFEQGAKGRKVQWSA